MAPDTWLARFVLERFLAVTYLLAFVAVVDQWRPLLGEHGLLPTPRYVARVPFRRMPSLFHWRYSDGLALGLGWLGVVLAALVLLGLPQAGPAPVTMLTWFLLWALYLSFVNSGQVFYGFGWESLLLEAGFLAIFLGPADVAPVVPVLWLYRWLAFRVEFGAGLIKLRGDRCWRDLTCLDHHHETQPLPNPLSRRFHHLPRPLHRVEVAANHVAQLIAPFGLFAPQPVAGAAATVIIVTQGWLVVSGNFAWLNLLTITVATAALPGSWLEWLPVSAPADLADPSWWFVALVAAATLLVVALSVRVVQNLLSPRQRMNASFEPLRVVNTYGAFGSITRVRDELVIEGTRDPEPGPESDWRAYEFRAKPGDPRRRPPQVAPYHLRLDWLMWFAALGSPHQYRFFVPLLEKILAGDRGIRRLLGRDPFDGEAPRYLRVLRFRYHFTTNRERRRTGRVWDRQLIGTEFPAVSLDDLTTRRR